MWSAEGVANTFVGPPLGSLLLRGRVRAAVLRRRGVVLRGRRARGPDPGHVPARRSRDPRDASHGAVELAEGVRWLWGHSLLRPMAIILGMMNAAIDDQRRDVRAVRAGGARRRAAAVHRDRLRRRDRRRRSAVSWPRRSHDAFGSGTCLSLTLGGTAVVAALIGLSSHWAPVLVLFAIDDAARDPLERDHRQPAADDHPGAPARAREQRVPLLRLGDDADRRRDRRPDGRRGRHVRIARLGAAGDVARVRRDPRLALSCGDARRSPPNASKRRGPRAALSSPASGDATP